MSIEPSLSAMLTMFRPSGPDLWAFWVLAGLWIVILSFVWGMVRWLRDQSEDEGHRGL
ncbi:hypothetical protein ENSA5_25070 [Enhygromyxa salina]|uniref:Uncharacterized protein n=1 Tax=Enhygromyxa salina TaxID=215803 RepID=A0A2S9YB83_9BACT|nr:hypothetical protein ENSA5_25070 [Enhygromyxa salina]